MRIFLVKHLLLGHQFYIKRLMESVIYNKYLQPGTSEISSVFEKADILGVRQATPGLDVDAGKA
jgi:hypothetical protein